MLIYTLAGVFAIVFLIQVYYYLFVFSKLAWHKSNPSFATIQEPVSVIICARNERENLEKFLDSILQQNYPNYEVVVVNDCSYDGSSDLLEDFARKYNHLKVVTIEEFDRFKHGKKFALTLGIKAAKNELLLLTDADSVPLSSDWITLMQRHFTSQKSIVLGFSPYRKLPGLLNAFIRFETFHTALQYFSYHLAGNTYMGVGRNLAYRKNLFFKNKGFASHMHIASGDDDLFVNQHADKQNTAIEISPNSFMQSEPKLNFTDFLKQKLRHRLAGNLYKKEHKNWLVTYAVSGILFYILLVLMLSIKFLPIIVLSILFIRWLLIYIIYQPTMKKLASADLIYFAPVLDIFYQIYLLTLTVAGLFKKQTKWK